MSDNFYTYLNCKGKADSKSKPSDFPESHEEAMHHLQGLETVTQDESQIGPWTHRLTVYVNNPDKSFFEEIKGKNGVAAVFIKEKGQTPSKNPPNQ